MGLPGGVTVRCRTLQHVARRVGLDSPRPMAVNRKTPAPPGCARGFIPPRLRVVRHRGNGARRVAKKPAWIIEKERGRKAAAAETDLALRAACGARCAAQPRAREAPARGHAQRARPLGEAVASAGLEPEIADPRKFPAPLDPGSVHQGAALETRPLDWGSWRTWRWAKARRASCFSTGCRTPITWARSCARPRFSAPARWSPRPAIRPRKPARWPRPPRARWNVSPTCACPTSATRSKTLKSMGYLVIGLDGEGPIDIARAAADARGPPGGAGPRGRGAGPARPHARVVRCAGAHSGRGGFRVAQRLQRRGGEPICIETD
jgi:23S rRNA (guanosine2251-2'-O)-methyltransferase